MTGDDEVHGYVTDDEPEEKRDVVEEEYDDTQDTAEDATERLTDDLESAEAQEPVPPVRPQSPVVKTVARFVTPFVVAFGVYLTLFGTSLPGGAFQGGVMMASAIILIGLAFGFEPTQNWLDPRGLVGLFVLGAFLFGGVAIAAVPLGGAILELFVYPLTVENMVKLVEVAIAALVSGVIIGLVVWLAAGYEKAEKRASNDGGDDA
ncbi:MnhB domain-containing protein [Natronobacterium gregoryi]|uniref:Multisubunit Na+/H+ antiporter, MnhB subunit n=2 Tax=Natronobacterium gregoryi TaxID=44930 RepID=L0AK85_NATGS|nr:MnhB domain-containing protein [Natronobacterium gregoryi]AFZ74196.1 multisubunit Na+/H+ antiporter, MnhB subunit [Natronobacterium gregoryi SP2]ELY63651.1 pH adaptation potassium efflux system protein B2, sodium/hydrogen antiporter subunit [Natronobacterium gregoryi SP2]PLK22014.1 pesticidal protein Cry4Aa [Natronobacterium gregoryi SP2]SFI51277.1 multisubunit sodium/proton antiporter, MrpB subunit [Natronobacterium gregoryi]